MKTWNSWFCGDRDFIWEIKFLRALTISALVLINIGSRNTELLFIVSGAEEAHGNNMIKQLVWSKKNNKISNTFKTYIDMICPIYPIKLLSLSLILSLIRRFGETDATLMVIGIYLTIRAGQESTGCTSNTFWL